MTQKKDIKRQKARLEALKKEAEEERGLGEEFDEVGQYGEEEYIVV